MHDNESRLTGVVTVVIRVNFRYLYSWGVNFVVDNYALSVKTEICLYLIVPE